MLATLIIVFREIIEAGIIVGIVLAATRNVARRGWWVSAGIVAGILGACIVALFASSISRAMAGMGQELFNVIILSVAVLMLAWHNVWMARHGREMAQEMKAIGDAVSSGQRSLLALAVVVGIAVLREGSEIVLFLYGIAISGNDSITSMALGALGGVALGGVVSSMMYGGLLRIPTRHLFQVTSALITLLAAGMAAQAVAFLEQAQMSTRFDNIVWDSSAFISSNSLTGRVLHTLIGYTDRPSLMQLMVYIFTLAGITILMRLFGHAPSANKVAA